MRGPRFDSKLSDDAAQLNASIDFDYRLLPYDVEGSKAHARMLAQQGILQAADAEAIVHGLDQVVAEWQRGELKLEAQLEDVHMNVEKRLTEIIGEAGARLHTARSRNDQVATDLRLYARDQGRQSLGAERPQDLDQSRRPRRFHDSDGSDQQAEGCARRHIRFSR